MGQDPTCALVLVRHVAHDEVTFVSQNEFCTWFLCLSVWLGFGATMFGAEGQFLASA